MAGIAPPPRPLTRWSTTQSRSQFTALAQLRWHIFRNGFRRKGGVGEIIARVIFFPIVGIFAIGPIVGAGIGAYYLITSNRLALLPALTWGIFALWQLVSINIAPPALSFDVSTILRFPLSFPRYLTARLFFGLLSASNVIGTLALLSADIGIGIAKPSLLPWATLLLATFALANIFFTRMIFAWIDRWLSTRRARELLTAFLLFASLGGQYLNVTLNPGLQGGTHHKLTNHLPSLLHLFHRLQPVAAFLPPGLTATSISSFSFSQNQLLPSIATFLGLIAFAALFLAIYAWRMQREFRGENLSELTLRKPTAAHPAVQPHPSTSHIAQTFGLSPTLSACLQKELIYLRRNTNQLYGFLAPIVMVFLFVGRIGSSGRFGDFVFPAAIAYSILGTSILSYNNLGMDGPGVQLYFLTPTNLRDVFLAKNLIGFLLNLIELVLIYAVICIAAHPPTLVVGLATLCWLLFATFTNGAIGNLRSLIAPRKIDLSKVTRKQTSQFSALLALIVVFSCFGLGCAIVILATSLHRPWLMIPILLALAIGGFAFYDYVLNRLTAIAFDHREALAEELCKA